MKSLKLTCIALLIGFASQAQINTPQASPAGSVYSKIGLTDVTIDYFRPKVKGRKIFGSGTEFLQPYGTLWRTGANTGTILKVSTPITIAGQKVEAGEYMILSIPGKDEWTFILNSDLSIGGNVESFKEENQVIKTTVKPTTLSSPVETLTFNISDISEDNTSASIHFTWSNVSFKVPFEVSFIDQVMQDIDAKTQVNPSNYVAAASFYLTYDKDLNKALEWMNKYLAIGDNSQQFWNQYIKAQILAKMGRKNEAISTANKAIETAKASGNDFGYVKLNQDLINSLK